MDLNWKPLVSEETLNCTHWTQFYMELFPVKLEILILTFDHLTEDHSLRSNEGISCHTDCRYLPLFLALSHHQTEVLVALLMHNYRTTCT